MRIGRIKLSSYTIRHQSTRHSLVQKPKTSRHELHMELNKKHNKEMAKNILQYNLLEIYWHKLEYGVN
ncbi:MULTISPECIES: hypothetical protein [Sulfolobaceae]|uniref:hypothetical protein n=1 Tax=Sulfolobaceae TaxID=118883 RepID=UPI0012EA1877|nr:MULTISPECIES: hypothetical protein [unclassified Sulfolobus]